MMKRTMKFDFPNRKGTIFDRRGLGIELALLVLLVVSACSTLLVSSALMEKDRLQYREEHLLRQLVLDEVAEGILAGNFEDDEKFAEYAVFQRVAGSWKNILDRDDVFLPADHWTDDVMLVITDFSGSPLLTVGLDDNNVITQWKYH